MTELTPITVRAFQPDDAPAVSRLILEDLLHANSREYGKAAVAELAQFYTPAWLLRFAQNGETYVALQGAAIVGTATLEQDRVRNVFVRLDHHQQGIGRLLMQAIEASACRLGQARLVLSASLAAVDFYRRLGYTPLEEIEETIGPARIKMVRMEKRFDSRITGN